MKENENDNEKRKDRGEGKPHFIIPDTEVEIVDYDPTARPQPLDIDHREHGIFLNEGIRRIKRRHEENPTPISEEVTIFKIELHDGQKVDARGDYEKIFLNNNIKVNAIKKSNIAIVSADPQSFKNFNNKLERYIERNGNSADFFQYIKSISELAKEDKESKELEMVEQEDDSQHDIQLTLVPNLLPEQYEKMYSFIKEKIKEAKGEIINEPFILSNDTPIIRALVPSSGLSLLTDQEIILHVASTPFFGINNRGGEGRKIEVSDLKVDFMKDIRELPIICILDDGINLPDNLESCIAGRWTPDDINGPTTCDHGTKVASCAILGDNIETQIQNQVLTPRVRVIDAIISDGVSKLPEEVLIKRIQKAVVDIMDQTRIFCLSFNRLRSFDDDSISNISYELDILMRKYNVQFVFPTGNHKLWEHYQTLEEITDDETGRIASPGESFFGITVGAITSDNHKLSISNKGELAPFSRYGFGFSACQKPDLVYPGGNVYFDNQKSFITSGSIYTINNQGQITLEFGTSYSAPMAAADLALLTENIPGKDSLIGKALLLHHAEQIDDLLESRTIEERELLARMYGKGRGSYINALESFQSRATFIRRGKMSRLKKQRLKFYMPSTLSSQAKPRESIAKVSVTCISLPPIDKSKGYEYLRAFIDTSLKCINSNDNLVTRNPSAKEGRVKWQNVHHFSQILTTFNPGDYQIWLQLYTKPEMQEDEEVEFVTIVTIEDLTGNNVDVYGGIQHEASARFETLAEVEVSEEI